MTRAESKERTRQRLLAEAQRLFRERGYAATSLEQIAEAAEVTKGAVYGHFASKEDLLITAIDAAPTPEIVTRLNEPSRPMRDRLAEFTDAVAAGDVVDAADLAMSLEFFAALLRVPDARQRYGSRLQQQLQQLADADPDELTAALTPVQAWAIGHAMVLGLLIYQHLTPGVVTREVFEVAMGMLAGLYEEK